MLRPIWQCDGHAGGYTLRVVFKALVTYKIMAMCYLFEMRNTKGYWSGFEISINIRRYIESSGRSTMDPKILGTHTLVQVGLSTTVAFNRSSSNNGTNISLNFTSNLCI